MKLQHGMTALCVAALIVCAARMGTAQEPSIKTESSMETQSPAAEPDVPWVWAEVMTVDRANVQMTIKYLDYETDTEKEMVMGVDEHTAFENAKSLNDIKPQDTVSIDYVVGADGKNTARTVNVEKADTISGSDDSAQLPPPDKVKAGIPLAEDNPQNTPGASSQ